MPQIIPDPCVTAREDRVAVWRAMAADKIHEIAARTKIALAAQGIHFPMFYLVPASGNAIITIGTTHEPDPSDDDWAVASEIAQEIVGDVLDVDALYSQGIGCSIVHPSEVVRGGGDAAI